MKESTPAQITASVAAAKGMADKALATCPNLQWTEYEKQSIDEPLPQHATGVTFLITAGELRDRKTKRRRKHVPPGPSEIVHRLVEIGLGATPNSSPTERLQAARESVSAAAVRRKSKGK